MVNDPQELILEHLKAIRASQDETREDIRELKSRVTLVEKGMAKVQEAVAGVNGRIDRVEVRLDRIEKRLDLVEA